MGLWRTIRDAWCADEDRVIQKLDDLTRRQEEISDDFRRIQRRIDPLVALIKEMDLHDRSRRDPVPPNPRGR